MLRSIKEIRNYVLSAEDGEIGRCKDFLLDETGWVVRYMVADTRKWLPGRKVLVSPIALGGADHESRRLNVRLTCRQIRESPPLDEDAPVSRQYETAWFNHYGWPYYWVGTGLWGTEPIPALLFMKRREEELEEQEPEKTDLRSMHELDGYRIQGIDRKIGHVGDFIVHTEDWRVCYLVVDTGAWLPGKQVCLSPWAVRSIDWLERRILVGLTAEAIEGSPEYHPDLPLLREYEVVLHDYYGWPRYWE